MKEYWNCLFLDNEKDMIVSLFREGRRLYYELETPNHHTGNLIRNFARLCGLPLSVNEKGLQVIRGEVPCYIDARNQEVYILRFADTKVANIYTDGRIEMKASVPAVAKTLMSQTKDYRLDASKTIFKTYILRDVKFRTDLHTHMNGNLSPDVLIALGIMHQIRYPLYYIRKLDLVLTDRQEKAVMAQREKVAKQFVNSELKGKYLTRRINDNTFVNFADLILNNLENAEQNIVKIRISLAVLKDGQAVFTNLEKVYLYRYVFTKGKESTEKIRLQNIARIPDEDVRITLEQMIRDRKNPDYAQNTIFQDKLLWIARQYERQGIEYVEISDTTLVKKYESLHMLEEVHQVMPKILKETGVLIRFLAAMRRIPLTIVKDSVTPADYLVKNLTVLNAVMEDPYVAGCDFVGEEINDIQELAPAFREIVKIARRDPDFVIRVHAGENDSLRDNVAHSIQCVKDALAPGQQMPQMRIGHGLYTCSLRSEKGKELLRAIRDNHIVLEFQLSSNVRLNNLNLLDKHPLHQYLRAGIHCVQGTDGGALYGTNSIDEQLSLEKLLNLTHKELRSMKETENAILTESRDAFQRKTLAFRAMVGNRDFTDFLLEKIEEGEGRIGENMTLPGRKLLDSNTELEDQIEELPWDRMPVVVAGGSFNTQKRTTRVTPEGTELVEKMVEQLSPREYFFVLGHTLQGYERHLLECNRKRAEEGKEPFRIFCFVPARLTKTQLQRLKKEDVRIRVSTESQAMGIYKSFNYEIFERRPSVVVAFDGNSAAENLIQEAKNGKGDAKILVWERAGALRRKAVSLEGYVRLFETDLLTDISAVRS
ncbi:MAG: adenosine deaminase [Bacillota bacterium]|nr:adenosine deaminase [Bacillota bacterium]